MTNRVKKTFGIISIIIISLLSLLIFFLVKDTLIELVSDTDKFKNWVDSFGFLGKFVFIAIIVLQVVIAIIPGEPFEIAAGYCFGGLEGTILCLIGIIIGSIIIFLLVKNFGIKFVELFFSKEKIESLKFLKNSKRLGILLFIIMFIPGTPKDLFSYFAPLTKIKLHIWILIVSVSRIPSVVTSTIGGSLLLEQKYMFAIIAFTITLILSGSGLIIYNKISKKLGEKNEK